MLKTPKMKRSIEASDQHSTALQEDNLEAAQSLENQSDITSNLNHLHQIANHLYDRMTPVNPDEDFKASLKVKLASIQSGQEQSVEVWTERKKKVGKLSRTLATVVSVIAVIAVIARIIGSIFVFYAYITGRKQKQTATV